MSNIKVRFAPSPTGPLHIGGARSALFNYLYAVHKQGELVLRIEDTDVERSKREYEQEIIESLQWLGIKWTEGMGAGGYNGPYRQTERVSIYQEYAQNLLESGQAYYCFCTEEELEQERQDLISKGDTPRYLGKCRYLTDEEREAKIQQGIKPTIRFQVPASKIYVVDDIVRGRVSFESDGIGDFIIIKSDGLPTYNFAVVIDDVLMGITHVIRAEEHLSNTPRQLMIYEALNLKRPVFAHISLILGSDRQKMSKRHGATSLIQYREMGYLPAAMFNFLSLMGWAPEGEEQLLSPAEIAEAFTLERVSKSPAVFDMDKLNWINQQYIKKLDISELAKLAKPFLDKSPYSESAARMSQEKYELMIATVRDHLVCLSDITREVAVIFDNIEYEPETIQVLQAEGVSIVLQTFIDDFPAVDNPEDIKQHIKAVTKKTGAKPKNVFMPLRCAVSGKIHGPDLPSLISIWGKEETLDRINSALQMIHREQHID
ncbi:glutamyl-trna synthetase [hydrocarbon metagenome]|uniref:glutamate--tRNA ligase n=1 Tax=hydrocarbon metagenome TaxID=938273 RepID=A0A0W8E3C7_9ZZZZ